jgi:hypothetical protein
MHCGTPQRPLGSERFLGFRLFRRRQKDCTWFWRATFDRCSGWVRNGRVRGDRRKWLRRNWSGGRIRDSRRSRSRVTRWNRRKWWNRRGRRILKQRVRGCRKGFVIRWRCRRRAFGSLASWRRQNAAFVGHLATLNLPSAAEAAVHVNQPEANLAARLSPCCVIRVCWIVA